MKKIKELYSFQCVAMLGHSTGAQDALYFARYGEAADSLDVVVLQSAVGDHDYYAIWKEIPLMRKEAEKLKEGKENAILTENIWFPHYCRSISQSYGEIDG